MFGIGFLEILVILIVSIIVIKPKDLPEFGYKVGLFVSKLIRLSQMGKFKVKELIEDIEVKSVLENDKKIKTDELEKNKSK